MRLTTKACCPILCVGVVISALAASREKWHMKRALVDLCVCPCSCNEVACALWYNGRCDCDSNFISVLLNTSLCPKLEFFFHIISIFIDYFVGSQAERIGATYFFQGNKICLPPTFARVPPTKWVRLFEDIYAKSEIKCAKKFPTLKAIIWECREWYNCLTPFPPGWVRPSIKEQNLLTSLRHCRQVFHDYDDRDEGDDGDDGDNDDEL